MKIPLAAVGLPGAMLAAGLYGIHRSLWLDEAWVANSVLLPSVQQTLFEGEWLQTSPLGFVLAAKLAPAAIEGLRAVPLIFALLAVGLTLATARRVVAEPFAVLVTAVVAFDPVALEYLRSFKQFGAELSVTSGLLLGFVWYISRPERRFPALLATVAIAPLFAYPSAFLIPGVIAGVWAASRRRALILAAIAAAEFGILYYWLIRPNVAPELWQFWSTGPTASSFVLLTIAAFGLGFARRNPVAVVCLSAIVLLTAAEILGVYPVSPRTRLFIRPCLFLPIAMLLEGLPRQAVVRAIAWAAAIAIIINGLARQIIDRTDQPFEAYAEAVSQVRSEIAPGDLLLVHANASEGFRLHSRFAGWDPPAGYGRTGWPCCRREENTPPGGATREAVLADLNRMIPTEFDGRIWLVFANRDTHWEYIGLDEGKIWRNTVWERGCPPGPYMDFGNVVVSPMNCASYSP